MTSALKSINQYMFWIYVLTIFLKKCKQLIKEKGKDAYKVLVTYSRINNMINMLDGKRLISVFVQLKKCSTFKLNI